MARREDARASRGVSRIDKVASKGKMKAKAYHTRDILSMAESICNLRKGWLVVSESILWVLEDTIRQRKECVNWYTTRGAQREGHQYFISVLKQVLSLLRSYMRQSGSAERSLHSQRTLPDSFHTSLTNIFGQLSVESPTDTSNSAPRPL